MRRRADLLWSYGVTTVPSRANDLLPQTLSSLAAAGFDRPRLFVDGLAAPGDYLRFGLEVTCRHPTIGVTGNWFLSLAELWARSSLSHMYAIFQDDVVVAADLRRYLSTCPLPTDGYFNLMTFMENEKVIEGKSAGWYEAAWMGNGRKQFGRSATALVFPRDVVHALLSSGSVWRWFQDTFWGHRKVDAAIVAALNGTGLKEYVHNPSLVQHMGDVTSMKHQRKHPKALSYSGACLPRTVPDGYIDSPVPHP